MKIELIVIAFLLMLVSSCSVPRYLPHSKDVGVNEYGGYITIKPKEKNELIKGELIAIDSNEIVVLHRELKKCVVIPVSKVKKFTLRYARPKPYHWSIPISLHSTIVHGWYLVFTAPFNSLVTSVVTIGGKTAFRYNKRNMTYEQLKMFARFPQGVPENIMLENQQ